MKKNLIPGIAILVVVVILGFVAFRFRSSLPFLKNSISQLPEKKSVPWPNALAGKVLFVSPRYGLAFGNPDGTSLVSFNKSLTGEAIVRNYKVSPDAKKIFFDAEPRGATSSAGIKFYVASLDGSNVQDVLIPSIKSLGSTFAVTKFIWSQDSRSVLLEVGDLNKNAFSLNTGSKEKEIKHLYFNYDVSTGETKKIYEASASFLEALYFNFNKNQILYYNGKDNFLVDYALGKTSPFPSTFFNQRNGDGSLLAGVDGTTLFIYKTADLSTSNPVKIDFSDLGNNLAVVLISWSSDSKMLAVTYLDKTSGSGKTRIYSSSGKRVSDINFMAQEGSVFSADNSKFLAVKYGGTSIEGYYQTSWQEFDTKLGTSVNAITTTPNLSFATYWF